MSGILIQGTTASSQDTSATETAAYSPASPATLSNVAVVSSSGIGSTSTDDVSFYGYNSGILAKNGASLDLSCATVTTTGTGNGVFAFNGATINLTDVSIKCTGSLGHGVDATYGGKITLKNVNITTTDSHAGALATDRGGGTIEATGGIVSTEGGDSPGVYSTGTISVTGGDITANGGEGVVIEGQNTVTLTDTQLLVKAGALSDPRGLLIYQSFSGDAQGTGGVFTMTGGALTYTNTKGPLFCTPTTTATLHLDGVTVSNASSTLLSAAVVKENGTARWSVSGSPVITLDAKSTALTGDIVAEDSFAIAVSLATGSSIEAGINNANTAKSVEVTLDATSSWKVTGESHVTCVRDASGISGTTVSNLSGDYDVYYQAASCTGLSGTYTFASGKGSLKPAN